MSVLDALHAPRGWRSVPFGRAATRTKESGRPDLPPLSVFLGAGVVPRDSREDNHNQLGEDLGKYLVVRPGDLVFNKLRTWQGGLGASEHEGIVSPAYFVCRPTPDYDSRFLQYLLLSDAYLQELTRVSKWQPPSQFDIGWEQLRAVPIVSPDVPAQRAIADYLDTETARIDALITKKQRMIELLDERLHVERRRSFADSRGWRLKHLLRAPMAYGILVPEFVDPDSGVRMLRITNLDSSGGVVMSEVVWVPQALSDEYRRTLVASGDLVVSVVGSMGRAAVISNEVEGSNLNRALARVQLRSDLDPWIMWHWTQTIDFLDQARLATGGGTAQPTLNLGDLAEFIVGLPADPTQWSEIAANLSEAYEAHLLLTSRLRRQIELLREHRQALITAAVTGEFEVPGVAS